MMKPENRFYEAVTMLMPFEKQLSAVPKPVAAEALEIRIRSGKPIVIETASQRYVCGMGQAGTDEIYTCIKNFCNYSIHSCQRELSEGWITLKGGHRAGFTGTAHMHDGKVETIKDMSSINLRIAREHKGISDSLWSKISNLKNFRGILIAGSPLSGKTTFLRDLCRNIGNNHKVSVIDERSEIAAVFMGVPQNDVGLNTDILNCFQKSEGIETAIRVMSPEYIVCDEAEYDIDNLLRCRGCGVRPVLTIHSGSIYETADNPAVNVLINSGAVNYIVFLDKGRNIGNVKGLWYVKNGKDISGCNDSNNLLRCGNGSLIGI